MRLCTTSFGILDSSGSIANRLGAARLKAGWAPQCAKMKVASRFRDSRLSTPPGECSVAVCSLHAPAEQKAGFAQCSMQTLSKRLLEIRCVATEYVTAWVFKLDDLT
jgi:hypothetical protein